MLAEYGAFAVLFMAIVCLGVVVGMRRPSRSHRIFLYFVVCVVLWMTSNFLENDPLLPFWIRSFLIRTDFAMAVIGFYFFMLFSRNFPVPSPTYVKIELPLIIPALIMTALSFDSSIISRVYEVDAALAFDVGPLYWLYCLAVLAYFLAGVYFFFNRFRRSKGIERRQLAFVLVGCSFAFALSIIMNLLFQNLVPVTMFRLGVYSLLFLVAAMSYAIIKHHLFDIKIIAAETFAFFISAALLMQVLISESLPRLIFNVSLFITVFGLLILFLKGVIKEVQRREEIQKLAASLETANAKLAELSEMKSNFVSIASHQLRAPIGGVRGYLLLAREGDFGRIGPKMRKILDQCLDQLDHLLHVISMFLDVTKIESGKLELDMSRVDLRELVRNAVKDNELAARNKRLQIVLALPEKAVMTVVDPGKIRDVMFNLIENAIKYTHKGRVTVTLERSNGDVEFRVVDTGVGIASEEVPRLFAKFVRAGGGFRVTHGSGLGLYIAKTIVEAHHGTVLVASAGEGKGSTFGFRLPIRREVSVRPSRKKPKK